MDTSVSIEVPRFVSARQFSRILGIGFPTTLKWLGEGLPFLQPRGRGSRIIIDLVRAVKWVEEHTEEKKRAARVSPANPAAPIPSRTRARIRTPTGKPRGRPRKHPRPEEVPPSTPTSEEKPRRKRGRPPKRPEAPPVVPTEEKPRRKRGRPPKQAGCAA